MSSNKIRLENYKKAKLKICNNRAKTFFANTNMSLKDFAFEIASSLEKIDSNTSRSLNELPHRLEEVIPGIINDSKSTNSASLLYAIKKLNFDGNPKQTTLSEPNASTAIAATRALSIPPDNPKTVFS